MATCKICLRKYQTLRFRSLRECVCGHCANALNDYKEVAQASYPAAREWLLRGMLRRATIDIEAHGTLAWKLAEAERIVGHLDPEVDRALPKWINKLISHPKFIVNLLPKPLIKA
jgi:hypothetical protein